MDKKLQDLMDATLRQRFDLAFLSMKEECPAQADTVNRLVQLSDTVEHHPGISEEARGLVQEFLSAEADNNDYFQKYLYLQGARDCVAVLCELKLIKYANGCDGIETDLTTE